MIGGQRRGPFSLDKLPEAGVKPDTYVWTKGMPDWEKAEDVAEICRMFRRRLYDLMHPSPELSSPSADQGTPQSASPAPESDGSISRFDHIIKRDDPDASLPTIEEIDAREDKTMPPHPNLALAILATILFFPPTGFLAIYAAIQSKKLWKAISNPSINVGPQPRIVNPDDPEDMKMTRNNPSGLSADDKRNLAHAYSRASKMWTLISFFLGIIVYAFIIRML